MENTGNVGMICAIVTVINPFQTNGIFYKTMYDNARMVHCICLGLQVIIYRPKIVLLFLKIDFVQVNSEYPDEMPPCFICVFTVC